jgi:hypothetical protein
LTISLTLASKRLACDGATKVFNLANLIYLARTDLAVTLVAADGTATTWTNGVEFTLSGDGTVAAGVLTTNAGPAYPAGATIVVMRATDDIQNQNFLEGSGFPAQNANNAFDRRTLKSQEQAERVARTLRIADYEAPLDMSVPPLAARKGKILGFDSVTGKPSIAVLPTLADMQAVAATATAAAAAAAADRVICDADVTIFTNAPRYRNVNNIFEMIQQLNPGGAAALIAQIQANTAGYLDAYFNAAIAQGGTWFLPRGYYHMNATLNMQPGVKFWGMGDYFSDTPSQGGTAIYLGGAAGQWGMQMLNAVSGNQVEAFSLQDIYFNVTQHGIRWNSATGGFSDDSFSQGYMMRPRVERCFFGMDAAPGTGKGLQFSKCFDTVVRDCGFSNFSNAIDFQGSDIKVVEGCRFDSDTGYSINTDSQGTFGSSLRVVGNDFNDPYGFIKSTDLDISVSDNHMEFDRPKGRTTAAIQISGNAFHTKIYHNRVQPGALVTNWLSITPDVNRFLVDVFGNTTSAPTQMGGVDFRGQPYFSNGGTRAMISHGRNSAGDVAFPMNWVEGISHLPPGYAAVVTPSTAGVDGGASNLNPACDYGCFEIFPNASSTVYMQISDWGAYGIQSGALKGTLTIILVTAAGAAGQQGKWSLHDNSGAVVTSGTINHAVANQMYATTLCTSQAFATNCWLRIWNEDTGHGERFYVYSAGFKIG